MNQVSLSLQPETDLLIDLPKTKGLKIRGILRGSYRQPLIVIIHGRPGHANELLPWLFAHYAFEQGFASLRLYMYDYTDNTRNMLEDSLATNAADFETVIKYLRAQGAERLFAVGHSYGGLTILKARQKLDAAVLWDPSHGLSFRRNDEVYNIETDEYMINVNGGGLVESKANLKREKKLGDTSNLASGKSYPLKIMSAGLGILAEFNDMYIKAADKPKASKVLDNAHHGFDDSDEVIAQLFTETTDWLKQY